MEKVIRYVITYVNRDNMRTLADPRQGRYTYATPEEAKDRMLAIQANTSEDTLRQVYGSQALGTFEVRPCDCYPVHFDPMNCWWDS